MFEVWIRFERAGVVRWRLLDKASDKRTADRLKVYHLRRARMRPSTWARQIGVMRAKGNKRAGTLPGTRRR